ncbi:MAG: hypothetical protein OXP71_07155 [Candidatus Poribacteria bacterium]|nr:hypothetical protein [Candidatus Poribacteria bacterium]
MNQDKRMENHEFKMYWLSHSSPDAVFEWLSNQDHKDSYHQEEIEKSLIARNEPLINLGLALWGYEAKTGAHLFKNGDRTIKKAVMSGRSIQHQFRGGLVFQVKEWEGVLNRLLDSFDENLDILESYLSNEFIGDKLLVALYERQTPFDELTDEQWLKAIGRTISNPRLNTPYHGLMDFFADMSYHHVFAAAWKLFETLPVNETSAFVLEILGEKLLPEKPHDMDVLATIRRWDVEGSSQDSSIEVGYLGEFGMCRYNLARLIGTYTSEFKSLKNSDDIALRRSYYQRFRPRNQEEIRELFEKEKEKQIFLNAAMENLNLFMSEDFRSQLRECCLEGCKSSSGYGNLGILQSFLDKCDRLKQLHPEWFPDYNGKLPLAEVKDPVLRTDKRLEFLQKKVDTISKRLVESEDGDQQTLIGEVKSMLSESNQLFSSQISQLMVIRWGWLILGLLIGFILAKWLL